MMFSGLYRIFELMYPNVHMQRLFELTFSGILTWAFLNRLLNPFIDAALAIVGCLLDMLLPLFFGPIGRAGNWIDKHISSPIRKIRIQIPTLMKAGISAGLGAAVFALDHAYGVRIFQSDESFVLYPMEMNGMKFWVSEIALWVGGPLIGLAVLYTLGEMLKALDRLLDRTVRISFVMYW